MTRHGMTVMMLVGTVLRGKSLLALFTYPISLSMLFAADFCLKMCRNGWQYHSSTSNGGGCTAGRRLLWAVRKAKSS